MRFSLDLRTLAALPRGIKIVAVIIALDLVVLATAFLVFDDAVSETQTSVVGLRAHLGEIRKAGQKHRNEIETYPQLMESYTASQAEGLFADADQEELVKKAQDLASSHHLTNLHYKVESGAHGKTDAAAKLYPVYTNVSLDAQGLFDDDALSFWDDLLGDQATYLVQNASLNRLRDVNAPLLADVRAGRPAAAFGMKLSFHTLALHREGAATP